MDRLQSMEVFHWVVELGSFSRAAERLSMSNAMVTTHVAALEKRLGVRLLNRTTRRLSLTDDGAAYLEHCRRVLSDVEETEATLSRGKSVPRGRLRVDMPIGLGQYYIVPALPRFAAQYPELQVIATLDDRRVDLLEAGIDAAIRVGVLEDSSIIARKVYETGVITCASPDYLALHGEPQHPDELAKHQCLGYYSPNSGQISVWPFERNGERVPVTPGGSVALSHLESLTDLVTAGSGISCLPDLVVRRALASGRLKEILPDWRPKLQLPISVVYPQNRHLSAKVRAFVDFVAGLFPRARGERTRAA